MRLNGLNGMMMDYGVVHGFIFFDDSAVTGRS